MTQTTHSLASGLIGACIGAALALVAVPSRSADRHPASDRPAVSSAPPAQAPAPVVDPRGGSVEEFAVEVEPIRVGDEPITPVPDVVEYLEDYLEVDYEPGKIELGRMLFHDTRLSADNTLSCASCHDLRYGGVDRSPTAIGINGQVGPINTPTVFNATLHLAQFWDGRAGDLSEQADGPPNASGEMGSSWPQITAKLMDDESYVAAVKAAYGLDEVPDPIPVPYWLDAIAAYEQTLITPGAPFDQYLRGDEDAVTQAAKEGYQLFKSVGCIECHNGMAVGGESFQRMGRNKEYFGEHAEAVDYGRYNATGADVDRYFFKVPGLRNVALTPPYFHDGSQPTLADAVRSMGFHQLGLELTDGQVDRIVEFLGALTGTHEGRSLDVSKR